jgi:hypothetical protein
MFVIPCKYSSRDSYVITLVDDIRKHHPDEEIVVVDSDSEDRSYYADLDKYGVLVEDAHNKHWMVGAYWYAFKKYPDRDFYYFMHDSMRVKANLDHLKNRDLTIMCYFRRTGFKSFNMWGDRIDAETDYKYDRNGLGCQGPMFFCKRGLMEKLRAKGADKLLPRNKQETGYLEGAYGFFFEAEGYDLKECALFGDVLANEKKGGKSGPYPHHTAWQYPIEKFYGSHGTKPGSGRGWK